MKMRSGKCRNCVRLAERVAELERQLAAALARIAELEKQLASARKDSSTSSKPPSSDIVKPPRPAQTRQGRKRRRGGQPGHKRHERTAFPPEEVDAAWIYEWPESSLTSDWEPLDKFDTIQQVDLPKKLFEVTEHRARLYVYRPTGEVVAAPLVRGGGACRTGRSAAVGALRLPEGRLPHDLPGDRNVPQRRFAPVALRGPIGQDRPQGERGFGARLPTTASGAAGPVFGEKLLAKIKHLFRIWHRRDEMPAERWKREADRARRGVLKVARRPPRRSEAQNIAKRFRQHAEHYFRFLETPGVEPTNNAMEQRFRFVVIDRKITQGTRGETGRRWCERIWTALATCAQQGRSAFEFLYHSIVTYFRKQPSPSLLPLPP